MDGETQVIRAELTGPRVETGPVQFNDDWPGVFIRGDDCLRHACSLRAVLDDEALIGNPLSSFDRGFFRIELRGLLDLLESSNVARPE